MFVVRAKRTYGAFLAALGGMSFLPFVVLRDSVPSVAYGFLFVGTVGALAGGMVMLRPPRVLSADANGVTFYSKSFPERRAWHCPWTHIDAVHGEQRQFAGPDGPVDAHLIVLRLIEPARFQNLGELGTLMTIQLPELKDPHIMIWTLTPPAAPAPEVGRRLAAYLEQAKSG